MDSSIEFRARLIASLFLSKDAPVFDSLVQRLIDIQNETLDEAADTARDIDNGHYTSMKTAEEAIRAMKVQR